jgi:hypothetical protein
MKRMSASAAVAFVRARRVDVIQREVAGSPGARSAWWAHRECYGTACAVASGDRDAGLKLTNSAGAHAPTGE